MPFDWRTPRGYLMAWLSQLAGGCATYSFCIPILSFIFVSCWLFVFIAADITEDLQAFNNGDKVANENQIEKLKRFCDVVKIYTDAKQ